MLTKEQRLEAIAKIRNLPSAAESAVKGLSGTQLDVPYGEGKWTLRQVIHHLADSHLMAFARTKQILVEDQPKLLAYNQEKWAKMKDYDRSIPVGASLGILRGIHERWCKLFEGATDSDWTRTGLHAERGPMTLDDILTLYARHGDNHVKQITGLRAAKGW